MDSHSPRYKLLWGLLGRKKYKLFFFWSEIEYQTNKNISHYVIIDQDVCFSPSFGLFDLFCIQGNYDLNQTQSFTFLLLLIQSFTFFLLLIQTFLTPASKLGVYIQPNYTSPLKQLVMYLLIRFRWLYAVHYTTCTIIMASSCNFLPWNAPIF